MSLLQVSTLSLGPIKPLIPRVMEIFPDGAGEWPGCEIDLSSSTSPAVKNKCNYKCQYESNASYFFSATVLKIIIKFSCSMGTPFTKFKLLCTKSPLLILFFFTFA
jgi:hypothetical protein